MSAHVNRGIRFGLWIVLGLGAAMAAPAACFFPSYTFGEPEPSGSGGTGGTGPTTGTGGMTTSSSSSSSSSSGHGGGGAGGTGGTSSSSSSSSSSSGTPEDCTNGVDDNNDGKIDCADSGCTATHGCVSSLPAGGWTGYYLVYEGSAATDPGCPPEFSTEFYTGNGGLVAPQQTCSQCMCGSPNGQSCSIATVRVSNSTCAQQAMAPSCGVPLNVVADGSCYGPDGALGGDVTCSPPVNNMCPAGNQACNVGVTVDPATVVGGSCTPTPQVPNVPPSSWTNFARACQQTAPGAGCNGGQVCVGKPAAPYLTGICVSKPGTQTCPATYPNQHIYYDAAVNDTRGCSACTCSSPSGGTCSPTLSIYKDLTINTCNSIVDTIPAGGCKDIPGNPAVVGRKANNITVSGGTCTAGGGAPTGTVTPQNAVTFCCK